MVPARFFVKCVFVSLTFSLISLTDATLDLATFDDDDFPGDRICTNDEEFGSFVLQMVCDSMLPDEPEGTADAICQDISIKMLNHKNKTKTYTRHILVCKHNGSILGCSCAGSTNKTVGLDWDGEACY